MKRMIAIKRPRLNPMEDHLGRTRGHIWTHLDAVMAIRRWKSNNCAIKAHDRETLAYDPEIVAHNREIVAHDREIMAHDPEIVAHNCEIVGDAWSL